MQERIVKRAVSLLAEGTVQRVLAWRRGEFSYDVTPGVFDSAEDIEAELCYNGFCAANLSKYLIRTSHLEGRTLVFVKICDSYSLNQLLCEGRVDRNKIYVIGVGCFGMADASKLSAISGIRGFAPSGDGFTISTVNGDTVLTKEECLCEKCLSCKGGSHVIFDELLGEDTLPPEANDRFSHVSYLEALTPEERYEFWRGELSRCIRCNACRNVCPACSCESCVFDNPDSQISSKAPSDSFEENMFHIIRAFHVAGRCTDCGECSRVCPEHIPLHLLNRKFISDINCFYGEYQAGKTDSMRSPLTDYRADDVEPDVIYGK